MLSSLYRWIFAIRRVGPEYEFALVAMIRVRQKDGHMMLAVGRALDATRPIPCLSFRLHHEYLPIHLVL